MLRAGGGCSGAAPVPGDAGSPRLGPGPLPSSAGAVRDLARGFAAARGEGCEREKPPGTSLRVRCNFSVLPRHPGLRQEYPHGRAAQPRGTGRKRLPESRGVRGGLAEGLRGSCGQRGSRAGAAPLPGGSRLHNGPAGLGKVFPPRRVQR